MTGVIDYKAGNLKSVETALKHIGVDFFISSYPEDFIHKADRLIFPGVGDARAAMSVLNETGLGHAIKDFYKKGKPVLGICLGCQIILTSSEEWNTGCLDIVPGKAVLFPGSLGLKVPHMGWNQVYHKNRHRIFSKIPDGSSFYFVHSYYPKPDNKNHVIGETEYGLNFASAIGMDNLAAVQFHPEKSGSIGLQVLENFIKWSP